MTIEKQEQPENNTFLPKYLVIPIELISAKKIPWSAKALFALIHLLDDPEKGCWASNEFLGEILSKSPQTISNHIQLLVDEGFLKIKQNPKSRMRVVSVDPTYKKTYRSPIRKLIGNIKGKIKVLSKDNTDTDSGGIGEQKTQTKRNHLIDNHWNKLPSPLTKHLSNETKTYRRAVKLLNQLQRGTFSRNRIDVSYVNNHDLLQKKWTEEEIIEGMNRLSKLHTPGYWPENKSKLPRDLPTLLFNERTGSSFFLKVMGKEPELLEGELPPVAKVFRPLFGELTGRQKGRLKREAQNITEEWGRLLKNQKFLMRFPYPIRLYNAFYEYLADQNFNGRRIDPGVLSITGPYWESFIKELGVGG